MPAGGSDQDQGAAPTDRRRPATVDDELPGVHVMAASELGREESPANPGGHVLMLPTAFLSTATRCLEDQANACGTVRDVGFI
jgi:hypothetical protein